MPCLQTYGGPPSSLFNTLRDEGEATFSSLPAPRPSLPYTYDDARGGGGYGNNAGNGSSSPTSYDMSAYVNASGGCFHGDGMVIAVRPSTTGCNVARDPAAGAPGLEWHDQVQFQVQHDAGSEHEAALKVASSHPAFASAAEVALSGGCSLCFKRVADVKHGDMLLTPAGPAAVHKVLCFNLQPDSDLISIRLPSTPGATANAQQRERKQNLVVTPYHPISLPTSCPTGNRSSYEGDDAVSGNSCGWIFPVDLLDRKSTRRQDGSPKCRIDSVSASLIRAGTEDALLGSRSGLQGPNMVPAASALVNTSRTVYDFLLDKQLSNSNVSPTKGSFAGLCTPHAVVVDGIACITLGHGITSSQVQPILLASRLVVAAITPEARDLQLRNMNTSACTAASIVVSRSIAVAAHPFFGDHDAVNAALEVCLDENEGQASDDKAAGISFPMGGIEAAAAGLGADAGTPVLVHVTRKQSTSCGTDLFRYNSSGVTRNPNTGLINGFKRTGVQ